MKWTLFELQQINQINEIIDSFEVPASYVDVVSITNIKVTGKVKHSILEVGMDLNITCDILMLCAITLKEIEIKLNFNLDLIFGSTLEADYELTNPLELDQIVLGNILAEKPYRVFHETADRSLYEIKKEPHPAFQELKDLIKD